MKAIAVRMTVLNCASARSAVANVKHESIFTCEAWLSAGSERYLMIAVSIYIKR